MNAARRFAAILLALLATAAPCRAADELHSSLQAMAGWLGEWTEESAAGRAYRAEFRSVLGGRFVETWRRDIATRELLEHSMIGADEDTLIEYRFDDRGQLTVGRFDPSVPPAGRRVEDVHDDFLATAPIPELDVLRPFLGQWEVTVDWLDGSMLWAQMTNRAELSGRVVCSRVLAAKEDEVPYDRYRSFYFRDETGELRELTFTYAGNVVSESLTAIRAADGTTLTSVYAPGTMASIGIRKQLTIRSDRRMHWADDFLSEDGGTWERVIDANWVRIAPTDPMQNTMPIDDTLFAASDLDLRPISVERIVDATPEQVWNAWTTESGWKAAYAPNRPEVKANIELAPGGRYEWLFDGVLGCNGCQVLSYLPPRMLSVTWNAPVAQPRSRVWHTWVVVEIEPAGDGRSLVRTTQLGFGGGSHWDETREYFGNAWAWVLDQMADNLGDT